MSRRTPTFYVFHGPDEFTIQETVHDFKQKIGDDINVREFTDPKTSVATVLSEARQVPFLSDRRLVVVYGLLQALVKRGTGSKAELDKLVEELPGLPDSARLVFVETTALKDSHPVVKLIGENPSGYIKLYDVPKNPMGWIQKRADAYEVKIDQRAAHALASVVGGDLRRADAELDKMAAYIGPGNTITEDVVVLLTPYVAEGDLFGMIDAIGQRNSQQAMNLLHHKLDQDDTDPMFLFGMIVRQFRLLLQAREVIDNGGNATTIASAMEQKPFVAKKLAQQARNFSLTQLESIYFNLLESDMGVKRGKVDIRTALDLFVGSVTASS